MSLRFILSLCLALAAQPLLAGAPEVVAVKPSKPGMGWRFDVTLRHDDTGWDHYADGWEVLDAAGNRLGFRELMHPHVNEQPFTRSLTGVMVPDGVHVVYVRGRCSIDGWDSEPVEVRLPHRTGGRAKY